MSADLEVTDTGGSLPPFWDRSVVFVANLLNLFFGNEEQTQALNDEVGEVASYGGRLLPIINLLYGGPDNLLVLEREPDPDLCAWFRESLELSLPRVEVLPHRDYLQLDRELQAGNAASDHFRTLLEHGAPWQDGYVTDDTLQRLARAAGRQTVASGDGSRLGNNKLLLHRHITELGLPTAHTFEVDAAQEIPAALRELQGRGFQAAAIKSAMGASGIGLMKVPDLEHAANVVPEVPDYYFHEGPCLIQGWLEPGLFGIEEILSPSVQMFLNEEQVYLYDITEQFLGSGSVHEGNESPPPYLLRTPGLKEEIFRQAEAAGRWLHAQGYRGTASTDFLLTRKTDQAVPTVYICEINARVTGATYPSVLARHFMPKGTWILRNMRFSEALPASSIFDMLAEHGHLFDPSGDSGILPINFNPNPDGLICKGQFLCLSGSFREGHELLDMAHVDLPVEAASDRD